MPPKLGVIAGGGPLPIRIVEACRRAGRPVFVVVLDGQGDPADFAAVEHTVIRIGAAGAIMKRLTAAECTDLVMAGSTSRPPIAALRPDWWGIKFLATSGAYALGDDGLAQALIRAIENEGLRVVGADTLVPEMLMPAGVLGAVPPSADIETDIDAALAAARDLGQRDIGQCAVAREGIVIAREGKDGTDAMLRRLAEAGNVGGVFAKTLKPKQERRFDLPAFGAETVAGAAKAGLSGIVVEAGNVFLMDADATRAAADAAGLFVLGVAPGGTYRGTCP